MGGVVSASAELSIAPDAALELWTNTDRWATFVEGFAQVVERSGGWPGEGGKLVWQSKPEGRGRVTERVLERGPGVIRVQLLEDRLAGVQTARFGHGRFELELEYELTGSNPFQGLTDALFIRRALRDMLRRTVRRFAIEADEEARLR